MSEQVVVQVDEKTRKLLRLVKVSARLAKDRERYKEVLRSLARSMPKELRGAIAKYNAALRRAIQEPSPENVRILGELALEKTKELRSWRATTREQREIVSKIARAFYASLSETTTLAKELEQEFKEELEVE
jgi:ribosomal protein S17E